MKNIYIKLIDNFLSVIGVEDSMGKVVKSTIVIYDDFKNILIAERGKGKNTPKQWGLFSKELKGKEIDKPIKKRKYDKEDLEKRREKISVLMKQGLKQKQIADLLGVAQNTISREKKKIMGN